MCLILFAHDAHPRYRLVLAVNRDEFFARPTAAAGRWADAPHLVAGRDLAGGGTWLGVTTDGRWAAVTNFREPTTPRNDAPTRGNLVSDFLTADINPTSYGDSVAERGLGYNGFNLLLGDEREVVWIANRTAAGPGISRQVLSPGIYGISNHLLDTPWPKVARGKEQLGAILEAPTTPAPEYLLELLLDTTYAADHTLPSTGVPLDLERALSAAFISTPDYGTRSSTALLIGRTGEIRFTERSFDERARIIGEQHFELTSPDAFAVAGDGR